MRCVWRQSHRDTLQSPELRGVQGLLAANNPAQHGQQVHMQSVDGDVSRDPGDSGPVSEVSLPGVCRGGDGGGPGDGGQGATVSPETGGPEQREEEAGAGADHQHLG